MIHLLLVMPICTVDEALASYKEDVHSVVLFIVRNHLIDQYVDEVGIFASFGNFDVVFWVRGGCRITLSDQIDFIEQLRPSII